MKNITRAAFVPGMILAGGCTQTPDLPQVHERQWTASADAQLGWNQWLGADRSNRSNATGLLDRWSDGGPELLWTAEGIGLGFASVAFAGNRVFTTGDAGGSSNVFALDVADGKVVWFAKLGSPGGSRNQGPRATPSTDGELVFGLGHDGELVCVSAEDGSERWRCNLESDYGGRMMSSWGFSESPLIDGDLLVCTPGGSQGAVLALSKGTGEPIWRCTEISDAAGYSSLIAAEIGGVPQYIVFTGESVAGIEAKTGKLLWRGSRPGKTATCSTPVCRDGLLFVSSGYGVGCDLFRITVESGSFEVEKVWSGKQLQSHHGGMVLVGDHVYGIGRRNLKCIELATGRVAWEEFGVGKGAITWADGHLVIRSERSAGTVAWVEATPKGYVEKGRFDPPDPSGEPIWSYPVVHDGMLYLRDQSVLRCYGVRER